jgi:hypothetical protein
MLKILSESVEAWIGNPKLTAFTIGAVLGVQPRGELANAATEGLSCSIAWEDG